MENDKELREQIRPVMEQMVYQLVCEKPSNPVRRKIFITNTISGNVYDTMATKTRRLYFKWYASIIFNYFIGLTIEERNELERLRNEIKRYREMESHGVGSTEDDNHSEKSAESVNKKLYIY
jgi:hypothetical protein